MTSPTPGTTGSYPNAQRAVGVPPHYSPYGPPGPAPQQPAPVKRSFGRVMKVLGVLAFGLIMFFVGVAAGGGTQSATSSAAGKAAPTSAAAPADRGQQFITALKAQPGLSTTMSDADLIGLADKICDAIGTPGMSRDMLVSGIATSKLGPQVAPVLVDTAHGSYCPEKSFAAAAVPAAVAPAVPAAPTAPAEPAGPRTSFSSGTYEVGVDIAPGKYKTPGPAGGSCYWARLKNTDGDFDSIIANGNTEGPTTVTISKSDGAFETTDCTWTKVS